MLSIFPGFFGSGASQLTISAIGGELGSDGCGVNSARASGDGIFFASSGLEPVSGYRLSQMSNAIASHISMVP